MWARISKATTPRDIRDIFRLLCIRIKLGRSRYRWIILRRYIPRHILWILKFCYLLTVDLILQYTKE